MLIVVRGINLICGKQFMVLRKGKISMADSFTPLLSVEIGLLLWAAGAARTYNIQWLSFNFKTN